MIKVVQIHLGTPGDGRFGNSLFQYATARALADLHGAELQADPWIGPTIFEDAGAMPIKGAGVEVGDGVPFHAFNFVGYEVVTLRGWFQRPEFVNTYTRNQVRKWFKLRPEFTVLTPFHRVFHWRVGDKATEPFSCVVSMASYRAQIERLGFKMIDFEKVSEEESHTNPRLPKHLQLLVDFQILMQSRVMLRGNSTFAWWAAVLGNPTVYSARIAGKTGYSHCAFEPGNHCAMMSDPKTPDLQNPPET